MAKRSERGRRKPVEAANMMPDHPNRIFLKMV
jgi:hypothetical protein